MTHNRKVRELVAPQIQLREFKGLAHGELAMVYPEKCSEEAMKFFK